jgi:hypothetical protein
MSIDLLKDILLSPFGSFASVFSLFVLAFWLVYIVTKRITEIGAFQKHIESSVDQVYNRMDSRVDKIEGHIDAIRRDISFLKGVIDLFKTNSLQSVAQRKSPMALTDMGKEISEKIKAKEMITKNWDKIYIDLEENIGNKNAYDIQQDCLDAAIIDLSKFVNESDLNKIKLYAFNDGRSLAFYSPIFALLTRDKYFETKGINVLDVDNYDPTFTPQPTQEA